MNAIFAIFGINPATHPIALAVTCVAAIVGAASLAAALMSRRQPQICRLHRGA